MDAIDKDIGGVFPCGILDKIPNVEEGHNTGLEEGSVLRDEATKMASEDTGRKCREMVRTTSAISGKHGAPFNCQYEILQLEVLR